MDIAPMGWAAAAGAAILACATADGASAATQTAPTQAPVTERHDNLGAAVTSPAEDLNIKRTQIPVVLQRAVISPYDPTGAARCDELRTELARLDAALGPDHDAPPPPDGRSAGQKRGSAAASVVRTGVEAVTPYRGLIRRITGATAAERRLQAAVDAGFARRGFLKGVGYKLNCAPPASPAWFKPPRANPPPRGAAPRPRR